MMRTIERIASLREALDEARRDGKTVGFVPTMGYLHEGHLDLMRTARAQTDAVVISIFVNPLQFGPQEDLSTYPRDLERDAFLASSVGVDLLFAPSVEELYPGGDIATRVTVGEIATVGEGRFRPGHFDGVATVCTKLFGIVGPCTAFFGQKDAQQLAVIRQVVRDLDVPVAVVGCPTVREPDGLAMSSRNKYLSADERAAAAVLHQALVAAAALHDSGEARAEVLQDKVSSVISEEPLVELQYVDVADAVTFQPIEKVQGQALIQLAALVGKTRLIDNIALTT